MGAGGSVGGMGVFVGGTGGFVGLGGFSVGIADGVRVRVGRKVDVSVWVTVSVGVGVGTVGVGVKEAVADAVAVGFGVGVSSKGVGVQVLGNLTPVAVAVGGISTSGSCGGGKGFRLLDGLLNMTMIVITSAKLPARAKMVRIFQIQSFICLRRFNDSPDRN
ncbi:MAG: hypothetical protein ACYDGL_09335 [Bellilinea sp.]